MRTKCRCRRRASSLLAVPGGPISGSGVRAALPAIWTRLLGHPGFNADVIEDLNRPPGQRIVGLGVAGYTYAVRFLADRLSPSQD